MKKILLFCLLSFIASITFSQTTYTWIGGTGTFVSPGSYNTPANWSPARTTLQNNDALVFDLSSGSIFAGNLQTETIADLKIIQTSGTGQKNLTFVGTAVTLSITGNLTITAVNTATTPASAICTLYDGGNTFSVGGNLVSNAVGGATLHSYLLAPAPSTLSSGKIAFTGAAPSLLSGVTANASLGLGNVDISASSNVSIPNAFPTPIFYGNLNINGKLTLAAGGMFLTATANIGGTISGSGAIVNSAGGPISITGTAPYTVPQTVGTINFDNTSASNSKVGNFGISRPNSVTTFGTAFNNTIAVSGTIALNGGTFNDGGNTLSVGGGTMISTTNIVAGAAVHTGTGKINYTRGNPSGLFSSSASTTYISVGNITYAPNTNTLNTFNINSSTTNNLAVTLTGAFNFTKISTTTASVTLNSTIASFTVAPTGSITVPTGLTLDFNNKPVMLQSDATGTASIGTITGTLNNASNVTVQRFIPSSSRKKYTLVSSPVTSTINAGWQEGTGTGNTFAIAAGFGTQITGAVSQGTNGFDGPATSTNSIFMYNDVAASGSKWSPLTSTTTTASLAPGTGYLLFVRGDRSENRATTGNSSNTVLRATGTLTTGSVNFATSGGSTGTPALLATSGSYNLIANPYACAIDWLAAGTAKSNVGGSFYVYDPNTGTFITSDGTTVSPITTPVTQQSPRYIQSGQAFFILSTSAAPALTIAESSKVTSISGASNTTVFGGDSSAKPQLNLNIYRTVGNVFADGVVALFGNGYSRNVSMDEDAAKFANFNESFSLRSSGQNLSIEKRPLFLGNDTLYFSLANFGKRDYTFTIDGSNFSNTTATLEDKYAATRTPIDLTGNTTYNFTLNSDSGSNSNDRFIITLGSTATIVATDITTNNSLFVKMSPNPVSNQLQVSFKTEKAEQTTINIINSLGQIVKTIDVGNVSTGNITVPVSNLASGMYNVQLLSGGKQVNIQKIIKE